MTYERSGTFPCPEWSRSSTFRSPAEIHLQWFASPEEEGRTEEPSEYKLRKAREEGRVAKSQDLVAAIGLLLTAVTLAVLAPWMVSTLREMVARFLTLSTESDISKDGGLAAGLFFGYFGRLMLPIAAVGVLAALFGNILQTGFLFSIKPITPDFKKWSRISDNICSEPCFLWRACTTSASPS